MTTKTDALRDKLLLGVASWMANPLPQVGAKSTGLSGAPRGQDVYSATGCRGGCTSWAQGFVSSLASVQLYFGYGPARMNLEADQLVGDVPTEAELGAATAAQRRLQSAGSLTFYRGIGFLTRKQQANDRYQRRIAAMRAPEPPAEVVQAVQAANEAVVAALEGPLPGDGQAAGPALPVPEAQGAPPVRVARAAGIDNENWNAYSDTVPVYSVGVNTWAEEGEAVPFSSLYNHIAERITDPNATGALGALV
ncbi:unnamed protein product [Pieris macdunnoughi]|uniref:Uncharacterized protein n=1 Tax=Pieris macdunnoughi TaxID=345717 RepID=A0A821XKM4_9NEOP|nr:unnamed protein product [Pieris macdunnoughi]